MMMLWLLLACHPESTSPADTASGEELASELEVAPER